MNIAERKNRLRRTMMFLSAQRPNLIKDPYLFAPDSLIFDLEDAVAENQKDAARFSLYHAIKNLDYHGIERLVRINALDTPHWAEDVRVSVASGIDGIRIAKCETAQDVRVIEQAVISAEQEFSREPGSVLLMAALESPLAVLNAYEISKASPRMFGIALSGGDFRRCLRTTGAGGGVDMFTARGLMVLSARAAGIQCFDTVYIKLDDLEGFEKETRLIKDMGFDGKSIVNPRQIKIVHDIFAPSKAEIAEAERVVMAIRENAEKGIGIFQLDGKMLDIAFMEGAERTIALAKASGLYKGGL